jgi:hypothetical protein
VTGDIVYGIIRSKSNGDRQITELVSEERAHAIIASSSNTRETPVPDPMNMPHQKPIAAELAQEAAPEPTDPRLIIWWDGPLSDARVRREAEAPQVLECTYADVEERVLELLMSGAIVQVWSSVKTPRIRVDL